MLATPDVNYTPNEASTASEAMRGITAAIVATCRYNIIANYQIASYEEVQVYLVLFTPSHTFLFLGKVVHILLI